MKTHVTFNELKWICKPKYSILNENKLILETESFTSLHTNGKCAEALMPVNGNVFCMSLRVDFNYHSPLDQCGLVLYEEGGRKAVVGMEYHDGEISALTGIVYHRDGFDRNDRDLASGIKWMYYRIWVREDQVLLEYSFNGKRYSGFRRFSINRNHRFQIGIYACSPMESSFDCIFSELEVMKEEELL